MVRDYDFLSVTAILTPTTSTILVASPPNMSILVYAETFAEDAASGVGTYTAKLLAQSGTIITSTLEVVTLTPTQPTIEKGSEEKAILRIPAGQNLLGNTESGTVVVSLLYAYEYGRVV